MAPTLSERLSAIRGGLETLQRTDVAFRVHGSEGPSGHGHRSLPPIGAGELRALESDLAVDLPEELRRFACEVSAGGAAPGYGMAPIDEMLRTAPTDSLRAPFPLTRAQAEVVIDARRSGEDPAAFVGANPRSRQGVLDLVHGGCGWYTVLVLDGPMRGEVWTVGDFGWCPHFDDESGAPLSFLEWFERWLTDALSTVSRPVEVDPSATSLKLLRQLNAEVPAAVWRATEVETLDLRHNYLSVLPPEIGRLQSLRRLHLSNNRLETLPASLFIVSALERLELDRNRLVELPEALGELRRLEVLSVVANPLERIGELSTLSALKTLNLSATHLEALPMGLGETALERLRLQDIGPMELSAIGACKHLRRLRLERAQLSVVPTAVCEARSLTTLGLSRNRLRALPEELGHLERLVSLSASLNELERLPDCIETMSALRRVVLIGNPLAKGERERLRRLRPDVEWVFEARTQVGPGPS